MKEGSEGGYFRGGGSIGVSGHEVAELEGRLKGWEGNDGSRNKGMLIYKGAKSGAKGHRQNTAPPTHFGNLLLLLGQESALLGLARQLQVLRECMSDLVAEHNHASPEQASDYLFSIQNCLNSLALPGFCSARTSPEV